MVRKMSRDRWFSSLIICASTKQTARCGGPPAGCCRPTWPNIQCSQGIPPNQRRDADALWGVRAGLRGSDPLAWPTAFNLLTDFRTMRPSGRQPDALRQISLEPGFSKHAEGSCLVRFGDPHVLCTASVDDRVPPFLRHTGLGWVTAEYGMLARSTNTRTDREAAKGKQSGRTQEIQRLIGRSLRAVTNLAAMGERQIRIDCDVLQADGGTRTAAITGSYVALYQALQRFVTAGLLPEMPLHDSVAAISCGVF